MSEESERMIMLLQELALLDRAEAICPLADLQKRENAGKKSIRKSSNSPPKKPRPPRRRNFRPNRVRGGSWIDAGQMAKALLLLAALDENRFDLPHVVEIVSGEHADDVLNRFLSALGMHAVVFPLVGRQ